MLKHLLRLNKMSIKKYFITYSQEKYHYNELSLIQLHQIALQKKNNINKNQINEKHFKNFFFFF